MSSAGELRHFDDRVSTDPDQALAAMALATDALGIACALGDAVDRRLAPRGVAIHVRSGSETSTLFARGLRRVRAQRESVVAIERAGRRLGLIELVAPRAWGETERAWASIAARLAACELERIEIQERTSTLERQRAKLGRCVPAAVRDALRDSRTITGHVASVTVVFVDLRNYTAWAAARSGSEVFALLDRYALTASDVISRHGGWLVDLEGDGLMAAFGAPQPLAGKERAALAAALELAAIAPSLQPDPLDGRPALGIGIATGPGFAGFLRAVDHAVWSVVGETTNRAARLQQLARDRGVEITLDAATRGAIGECDSPWIELGPVALRGLPSPEPIWALRANAAIPAALA